MLILALITSLAAATPAAKPQKAKTMSFFDLKAQTIDGTAQALAAYKGKVVLVVNTASECGFTPQFGGLEKLWKEYKTKGFVLVVAKSQAPLQRSKNSAA